MALATATLASSIISSTMELVSKVCMGCKPHVQAMFAGRHRETGEELESVTLEA
jgi:hypothetical protein